MNDTKVILILENIRSVENTGSIFRTADGLGVSKVYLVGTTPAPIDRFGRKRRDFAKVALGAEEFLEWEERKDVSELLTELGSQGFQRVALEQTEGSVNIREFEPQGDFALVMGNEVEGVSQEALGACDAVVEIPMEGKKESLNVSVATGIALFVLR